MSTDNDYPSYEIYDWNSPIRVLKEEIQILENEMKNIVEAMRLAIPFVTSYPVIISLNSSSFSKYGQLIPKIEHKLYWVTRLESQTETFSVFWDQNTISPILYGILGGELESSLSRINKAIPVLTDIETGLLFDPILKCFLNPIKNSLLKYNNSIKILLHNIAYDLFEIQNLYEKSEHCSIFQVNLKWGNPTSEQINGDIYLVFPQSFLRLFNWRSKYA